MAPRFTPLPNPDAFGAAVFGDERDSGLHGVTPGKDDAMSKAAKQDSTSPWSWHPGDARDKWSSRCSD
jgi:hypothetical protein